jgi:hypothetical protein
MANERRKIGFPRRNLGFSENLREVDRLIS